MIFEEWWEEERVGYSREEELNKALHIDCWKVGQMLKEAFEAGYKKGYSKGDYLEGWQEGYNQRQKEIIDGSPE